MCAGLARKEKDADRSRGLRKGNQEISRAVSLGPLPRIRPSPLASAVDTSLGDTSVWLPVEGSTTTLPSTRRSPGLIGTAIASPTVKSRLPQVVETASKRQPFRGARQRGRSSLPPSAASFGESLINVSPVNLEYLKKWNPPVVGHRMGAARKIRTNSPGRAGR
jgi:hypothetical protein